MTEPNFNVDANALESLKRDSLEMRTAPRFERADQEKFNKAFEFMERNVAAFLKEIGPRRSAFIPWHPLLKIDSLPEVTNTHFGDEVESEPLMTEDMHLVEPEIITSSGRKVPKRNPKAKAWVSPYGGKRK